jgi:hypothetical protein
VASEQHGLLQVRRTGAEGDAYGTLVGASAFGLTPIR